MVVLYDSKTRSIGAIALPGKGGDAHATSSVVEFLQLLGHRLLVLKSDGEPAILALKNQVRAAAADVESIPQEFPPGDHKAAGVAENTVKRVKGLARTICLRPGCRLPHQHPLHYCIPELAATSLNRYSVGDAGKTAEQLRTGRSWHRPAMAFGETEKTGEEVAGDSRLEGLGVALRARTLSWSREPQCNGFGDDSPGNP
eukprot:834528-Amphidinium_carterae.1